MRVVLRPLALRQFVRLREDLTRRYATARTIHLVLDNLNTHGPKSLTDCFGEDQGLLQTENWA